MKHSDHFDGRHFSNPNGVEAGQSFAKVPRMMLSRRVKWPSHVETPTKKPEPRGDAAAAVTFIGHSTFLIQTAAGNVITDPIYSRHAGPFGRLGPRRVREPAVLFDDLPPISMILLSHCHYDHCDLPTLRRLIERFDPLVVTALGNGDLLKRVGATKVEELDWWDTVKTSRFSVTATPARHFSARTGFDKNRRLWCGFTFNAGERRIYFAGDTAYASFFKDIPSRIGPVDLALIPIGAYEPRWFMEVVHMNPAESVQAHLDVRARQSIAMHFGTFQLTTEGIDEPVEKLREECRSHGVPGEAFRALGFGESFLLP
jgi:L-ascorbate metabolism protein UlaG (beta-lactamase superfamily)